MNRNKISLIGLFFLLQFNVSAQKKEIVAYYPEWGPTLQHYYVKNIETSGSAKKITVLNYAFVEPGPDSAGNITSICMNPFLAYQQLYSADSSVDGAFDDSNQLLRGQFNQLKKLKVMHPHLKIIIAIGGWSGSTWFSDAALTPQSRENFVNDCIDKFIYGNLPVSNNAGGKGVASGIFDGFDLDWEYPVIGGNKSIHHNENDRDNLSELIKLFRIKLDEIKPGYLLTAAIPAGEINLSNFNLSKDQASLDWYNLMTYDFHGGWDNKSDHHTNLFSSGNNKIKDNNKYSFASSVFYLRDSAGVKPDKIIPGVALYGRGWKVNNSINYGLHQPGIVAKGIFESGFNYYKNLSSVINRGYTYHWDNDAMAPWLFNLTDSTFWSFDDQVSVALKTHFVLAHNLRGLLLWDISGDDSIGTLVNTIYSGKLTDISIHKPKKSGKYPQITLSIPNNSNIFYAGSDILINIKEKKINAPIVKVEFFADDKSLGYNTKSPFSWVWFNVPWGKHKLSALAIDRDGNKKYSKKIVINIKEK
jgi:chitinase